MWLLLAGCAGTETTLPTIVAPAATVQIENTAAPSLLPPTNTPAAATPATIGPQPTATAGPLATLTAVDPVLAEIDAEVCREALETRAEIEALLQQGQDIADLAAAVDELIAEIEGCAVPLTPTP